MTRAALVAALVLAAVPLGAQSARPRAEVTPSVVAPVTGGQTARLSIAVRLPQDVHVQAHEPRDPSLIPTVLTVEAPEGFAVDRVTYPVPTELAQSGRRETLAVLGPEFVIDVMVSVAATAKAGDHTVPAVLRYQACNDSVCFPPARAATEWRLTVSGK